MRTDGCENGNQLHRHVRRRRGDQRRLPEQHKSAFIANRALTCLPDGPVPRLGIHVVKGPIGEVHAVPVAAA